MSTSQERIAFLLESWTSRKATEPDEQELLTLLAAGEGEEVLQQHIQQLVEGYNQSELMPAVDWENLYNKIMLKKRNEQVPVSPAPVIRRIAAWKRWAVAASIILVVSVSSYLLFFNNKRIPQVQDNSSLAKQTDIPAPTDIRAVITLANGGQVYLDSAGNGTLAIQEGISVIKKANGEIVYQGSSPTTDQALIGYNTLYNPRGSKVISLTLIDGTKVWLNSESSLKYPTSFTGSKRQVEITGEAYFEVASAPRLSPEKGKTPFIVTMPGKGKVEVLGTHFNINSYNDEVDVQTTLLEGSVRVSSNKTKGNNSYVILKPGQQASLTPNLELLTSNNIDIDKVMAWKNGYFKFDQADIQTVMRQISRWYDVEVTYPNGIPKDKYWGGIRRELSLADIFKVLEESGAHFRIEGRKVVVLP